MIREKEKSNKEGRLWRLKKFGEESYREAVSFIRIVSVQNLTSKNYRYCKHITRRTPSELSAKMT